MAIRQDNSCTIEAIERIGEDYFRIAFSPRVPFGSRPGQFVMVRVSSGVDPLLRRPFSIHRVTAEGNFEILFRVVGRGTGLLSKMSVGDEVDVLAPLGTGFGEGGVRPLIVGGGIGVAPLLYLAEHYISEGKRPKLLLGGRSDRDLLCHDDFACLAVPSAYSTEDGTLGETGLVTELIKRELEPLDAAQRDEVSVHACGPVPMLAAVARLCVGYGVYCEVSLESHMACGVGACLGCIVKSIDDKNLRVCKDGPVFDATLIEWF